MNLCKFPYKIQYFSIKAISERPMLWRSPSHCHRVRGRSKIYFCDTHYCVWHKFVPFAKPYRGFCSSSNQVLILLHPAKKHEESQLVFCVNEKLPPWIPQRPRRRQRTKLPAVDGGMKPVSMREDIYLQNHVESAATPHPRSALKQALQQEDTT